jgi:hypothetical protein
MMGDVDEMTRAIIAADETTQLRAENRAMKAVLAQLVMFAALLVDKGRSEQGMRGSEFVGAIKRDCTNLLLTDAGLDARPALEVLRAEAVKHVSAFCDPIAAGLAQHETKAAQAAEGEQS